MAALAQGPHAATVERTSVNGVDAIMARPDAREAAGIVIAPDIGGLRPLFEDICRRLATYGFSVCAVEPFARVPASERATLDLPARMGLVKDLEDPEQLANLAAGRRLVADAGRVAVLGFCMGGYYALKAAAQRTFDRAVAFYGMIRTPDQWRGAGHASPVDSAARACPTLAIFGTADVWTPPEDIDALRAAWTGRDDCEIVEYEDAEHGFVHDPDRPAHRAADAADAWRRALSFLSR